MYIYKNSNSQFQTSDARANVLGIGIDVVDMQSAIEITRAQILANRKGYICFTGVHGVMEARRDKELRLIFSNSLIVAPDGMPTVWLGRWQGFSKIKRVFGPDFMAEIMRRPEFRDCVHFFCGGDTGVVECLRKEMIERFPWVQIAGVFTPPFRDMTAAEESHFISVISEAHPDIIWVGISTPKQEKFMAKYLPILETKIMAGVGAAFLFHTGKIKDSPLWVKQSGLQWLHRLFQEPRRLGRRYLLNNSFFIFHIILQLTKCKIYKPEPKMH